MVLPVDELAPTNNSNKNNKIDDNKSNNNMMIPENSDFTERNRCERAACILKAYYQTEFHYPTAV